MHIFDKLSDATFAVKFYVICKCAAGGPVT